MTSKLKLREYISYGLGDLGSNLVFSTLGYYLMYYYTNVAGIAAIAAGNIILVSKIFDAANDIFVGVMVDRTHSKYGKARPYMLWYAIPFAISATLTFCVPDIGTTGKIVWALITYMALTLLYTFVNLPYGSLLQLMTQEPGERSRLSMFRNIGGNTGGLIVSSFTMTMVLILGRGNQRLGYGLTAGIFSVIAAAIFIIVFVNCKERVTMATIQKNKINLKESFAALSKNKPWIIIAIKTIISAIKVTFPMSVAMYFVIFNLKQSEVTSSLFLTLFFVGTFLGSFVAPKLADIFGRKKAALITIAASAVIYVVCMIVSDNYYASLVLYGISGLPFSILWVLDYIFVADSVEYGEWKTGIRLDGLTYSAYSFATKCAPGIAGGIIGYALAFFKYQETAAVQSAETQRGFWIMMFVVPLILAVIEFIVMCFYNLDEKQYTEIVDSLKARRQEEQKNG
jgi:GPH family glycoside/pentoside/hexuronide:cation symporter